MREFTTLMFLGNGRYLVGTTKTSKKGEIKSQYTVDTRFNTCTCPSHVHRSTKKMYIECVHLKHVKESQLFIDNSNA